MVMAEPLLLCLNPNWLCLNPLAMFEPLCLCLNPLWLCSNPFDHWLWQNLYWLCLNPFGNVWTPLLLLCSILQAIWIVQFSDVVYQFLMMHFFYAIKIYWFSRMKKEVSEKYLAVMHLCRFLLILWISGNYQVFITTLVSYYSTRVCSAIQEKYSSNWWDFYSFGFYNPARLFHSFWAKQVKYIDSAGRSTWPSAGRI